MAVLIDKRPISSEQRVELYEEGVIWIIDDKTHKEIKLDAAASTQLLAFLQLHQDRLNRHARAAHRDIEAKDAEEQAHQDWANDE